MQNLTSPLRTGYSCQGRRNTRRSLSGLSARHHLGLLLPVSRNGSRLYSACPGAPRVQQLFLSARSIHSRQREDAITADNFEPIWNDVKYMVYNHPNRLDPDLICKGMSVVMRSEIADAFKRKIRK